MDVNLERRGRVAIVRSLLDLWGGKTCWSLGLPILDLVKSNKGLDKDNERGSGEIGWGWGARGWNKLKGGTDGAVEWVGKGGGGIETMFCCSLMSISIIFTIYCNLCCMDVVGLCIVNLL